jgi:hypothetical protein
MKNQSSIIWAIILIALGSIFFMDNFNFLNFEIPHYLFSWKIIFVFIAFGQLTKGKYFSFLFWGLVALFLFNPVYFQQFSINSVFDLWPLLLIMIGLDMLNKRTKLAQKC